MKDDVPFVQKIKKKKKNVAMRAERNLKVSLDCRHRRKCDCIRSGLQEDYNGESEFASGNIGTIAAGGVYYNPFTPCQS